MLLRKRLLRYAVDGAAYVPFIGDGDLSAILYADRFVYGADLDPARVATAQARLKTADIRVFDCNGWPFAGVEATFAVADLDAYANPYPALLSFWSNANKAERVIVFGTDGRRQRCKRSKVVPTFPDGETQGEWRRTYNSWWRRHVLPFVASTIAPYRIVAQSCYLRKDMLYWGMVCDA